MLGYESYVSVSRVLQFFVPKFPSLEGGAGDGSFCLRLVKTKWCSVNHIAATCHDENKIVRLGKKCYCYNSHQIITFMLRCFHFFMGATLVSVDYFAVEWKSRLVWKIFSKGYGKKPQKPKNYTNFQKKKKNPKNPFSSSDSSGNRAFVLFCTWLGYICVCLNLESFSSSPLFFFLFTLRCCLTFLREECWDTCFRNLVIMDVVASSLQRICSMS